MRGRVSDGLQITGINHDEARAQSKPWTKQVEKAWLLIKVLFQH